MEKEAIAMATLTVTSRGQVTLKKELLEHMGIEPGGQLEVYMLPAGRVELRARPKGKITDFIGCLAGKTTKVATLEEIAKAIEDGWAGKI
jgi:antitoxin PrlF